MDNDLSKKIELMAKEKGVSLNKLIKQLLRRSLSLPSTAEKKTDLSMIQGTLSLSEESELNQSLEEFSVIDSSEW